MGLIIRTKEFSIIAFLRKPPIENGKKKVCELYFRII